MESNINDNNYELLNILDSLQTPNPNALTE